MSFHAFVDESIRSDYIVCGVVIADEAVGSTRQEMRGLRGKGQRRLHMAKESDAAKRRVLRHISTMTLDVFLVATDARTTSQRQSRDRCLAELVQMVASFGARRLVVESCDQDQADRQVMGNILVPLGLNDITTVVHHSAKDEPLLWIADAVAWAYGKGGNFWKHELQNQVHSVKRVVP